MTEPLRDPEDLRVRLAAIVAAGHCSEAEAAEAFGVLDAIADREIAGELTPEQALAEVEAFAWAQVAARG